MLRHLAILKFKPSASEEARTRFVENFPNMARAIPQIKSWSIGRDAANLPAVRREPDTPGLLQGVRRPHHVRASRCPVSHLTSSPKQWV